ncbi:hypothetical protein [Halorarius litoreus]|uniref:hypothetical protein n=1 Tax=Halorarius litoreus TaxID=2962676 RepID=UPI0020CF2BB0|nr:hypothetical protein [Halorarius litoreus]
MHRPLTLLVALLVLLAGCAALTPGGTDTPTVTPTTTPTGTPLPDGLLAPGVNETGIENVTALFAAHQRELTASGFVTESVSRVTYEGTTTDRVAWTVTVVPGGDRVRTHTVEYREDGTEIVGDIWSNATHDITRRDEAGDVSYTVRPRFITDDTVVWSGSAAHVQLYATAELFEVASVDTRDGLRYVTLAMVSDQTGEDGVPDAQVTAVVDQRGRIHSVESRVQYGEDTTWTTSYRVSQIGDADPQPPAWLDRVPPNAALFLQLDAGITPNGVVVIEHLGGDPVPAGTRIVVTVDDTTYETAFRDEFEEGHVRYAAIVDGDLTLSTQEPKDGFTPLPSGRDVIVRIVVVTEGGVELFDEAYYSN